MGFGKGIYSFGNDKSHLLDEYSPLWSMSNVIRVSDYAWNLASAENLDPARVLAMEHLLALSPNPHAGRVRPIDLRPALTHVFNEFLAQHGRSANAARRTTRNRFHPHAVGRLLERQHVVANRQGQRGLRGAGARALRRSACPCVESSPRWCFCIRRR